MPWTDDDATRHTKKAKSGAAKHQWSKVANKVLAESGDEGKAMKIANAAVRDRNTYSPRGEKQMRRMARGK